MRGIADDIKKGTDKFSEIEKQKAKNLFIKRQMSDKITIEGET